MVSAGIPELSSIEDLEYLQRALRPELIEEKAAKKFITLIDASLKTRATQLNFFIHNLVHPN